MDIVDLWDKIFPIFLAGLGSIMVNYVRGILNTLNSLSDSVKELNVKFHARMESVDQRFEDVEDKIKTLAVKRR